MESAKAAYPIFISYLVRYFDRCLRALVCCATEGFKHNHNDKRDSHNAPLRSYSLTSTYLGQFRSQTSNFSFRGERFLLLFLLENGLDYRFRGQIGLLHCQRVKRKNGN
jgi:hypothetical protein